MEIYQKELNLLGLAQRAGQLITGDEFVEKAIKQGRIHLVLIGTDVSERTRNKYVHLTDQASVSLLQHISSVQISQALGRKRSIVGFKNLGMAEKFLSYRLEKEDKYDND